MYVCIYVNTLRRGSCIGDELWRDAVVSRSTTRVPSRTELLILLGFDILRYFHNYYYKLIDSFIKHNNSKQDATEFSYDWILNSVMKCLVHKSNGTDNSMLVFTLHVVQRHEQRHGSFKHVCTRVKCICALACIINIKCKFYNTITLQH